MENVVWLTNQLLELQRNAREGVSVDDARIDSIMHSVKKIHDDGINNNALLNNIQKDRRKVLFANAVDAISRYYKQSLRDDFECIKRKMK